MLLGRHPFLSSASGASVNAGACIDLAVFFKCSPYEFFDKPPDEIDRLCQMVNRRMKEIESE